MGILSEFAKSVGRLISNVFELIAMTIAAILSAAIWAVGLVIEIVTDIINWINDVFDELLSEGATEVNVISGEAFSEFIERNKAVGRYSEVSFSQLQEMRKGVVNVAMDDNGNIINDQMIRSNGGLSESTRAQFNGQPMIRIDLAS